ncbi:MAG: DNA repair protein RadC [Armatimonadetes bacterium]|nr:DNA repair protein RadC [Armatimonadota bacterium]
MTERYSLAIRDLPEEERPRERLQRYGPEVLGTPELIAILLRTGTTRENAVALAERLLKEFGGLRGLVSATVAELSGISGIGAVKAVEIRAAVELGKRIGALSDDARPTIRSPADAAQLVMSDLRHQPKEVLRVLLLDTRNRVQRIPEVSVGSLTESIVHPRELFREAIRHSSAAVIVVHNHPSGDPTPSAEDIAVTKRLAEGGKLLGIEVLDHVIIGDGRFVSLKERGLM